jgi:TolA-binding protein
MHAYHLGHYPDAEKLFNQVIEEYGIEDEIYASSRYYAADALLKMGKQEESSAGFEFIVNNVAWSNFREKALYNLGLIYFDEGKYALSRARLLKLLNEYPRSEFSGSALYWIGESYAQDGRLADAIEFLEKAIDDSRTNPYKDYTIYNLASVYEKTGDYENAVKYYDQLLSYYPNSTLVEQAQIRIGVCYFNLKDYHSSILELSNPVISKLPDGLYSESLYLLANSYYRVGEYANAENSYKEIIDQFPAAPVKRDAHYGLAWSLFQQQKYDDAYGVFDYLSEGDDSIAIKSFVWKGESKKYAGKNNEALIVYQQFLQRYPDNYLAPMVEYQMGTVYFDENNITLSRQYLNTATSSEDPVIRAKSFTLLGEMDLNDKKYLSAKKYFEPAVRITEAESDVHLRALLGLAISSFHLEAYEESIGYIDRIQLADDTFESDRVNFYKAENYFALGKYNEALTRYSAVTSDNKEIEKQAIYGKGYSHFNLGDYQSAAHQFSQYIEKFPRDERNLDVKLRLADSYFGSRNFAAASRVYRGLYSSNLASLDDPYNHYQYAQSLYKSGETSQAIQEFLNLQRKFPDSQYAENSLYTVGWIYFQEGNFSDAISHYKNVLTIYKNSSLVPIIYYSIGDAYFNMSEYNSAVENYEKVISDYPTSEYVFDAINGLVYSYVVMGRHTRAIELIDEFTVRNPNLKFSDQIFLKKGELYYSQRDYNNARISYQEFLTRYPRSPHVPEAYFWIGKSLQLLNQREEAVFYFTKVFEDYPRSESAALAVLEIGEIQNSLENYNASIEIFNKAQTSLKDSPRLPEILFLKGTTYLKLDDVQKAYDTFSELAFYHRETLFADKAKFEMGLIDLFAGRYETADGHFMEIAEKRFDDLGGKAQYHYGLSLYQQERFTEAISALVRIRTVFPGYDEWLTKSYLLLGDCYVELGDKRQAIEMYRVVVTKHKGDQFGEEARKKIRDLE